jgi:hypothetical protein
MAGTDLEVTVLGLGWITSSAAPTRVQPHLIESDASAHSEPGGPPQ